MIQPVEASELCSKSEWALVESSFSPTVETLSLSDLKSRLDRIKKLHQRCEGLIHMQHSDDRKRTTRRKAELFVEATDRFESSFKSLEKAHRVLPLLMVDENAGLANETRTLNMAAAQERADHEIERRRKHVLSAIAVRNLQQDNKSGSRRIQNHVGSAMRRQQARRDTKNS